VPTNFKPGANAVVFVGSGDLTEFFNDLTTTKETDALETTTFRKTARTYIPGLQDTTAKTGGLFDGDLDQVDERMDALFADINGDEMSIGRQGDLAGSLATMMQVYAVNYEPTANLDDATGISLEFQSRGGSVTGRFLKAKGSQSVTAAGSPNTQQFDYPAAGGLDGGATGTPTATGWTAFLHAFRVPTAAGSILDVKLYDSADGTTWTLLTGGAFANVTTTKGSEMLRSATTTATVRRYVLARVNITAPAGQTSVYDFVVTFARRRLS